MAKVIIASKNPVKINTTLSGFKKMLPNEEIEIEGISVPSNVPDQPSSNKETLQGAVNRVKNAKLERPDADYWVGIEGGIDLNEDEMETFAWIVIESSKGLFGKSRTSNFLLPKKVVELVRSGKELGEADDLVFSRDNSKQKDGAVGILTNGVITRESLYEPSVILALMPIISDNFIKNN